MTLRHFQIFISVCDEQGMTQAARQLHISQPSISQAVKELEEHYQVRLFERLGKKLFLTPAGQELLHYARHIISLSDQTEKTLRSFSLAAPIRLGATLSIGESIFIDIITRLKKAMPEQEVYSHVHNTAALEDALLRDELDAALVEGSITSAYLTQIPFLEDELVFIIAPDQLPPAGFTMEQLVAFGDSLNDMSMLLAAGTGVAMTNAVQDTLRGDNVSGVAHAVQALLTAALIAAGALLAVSLFNALGGAM